MSGLLLTAGILLVFSALLSAAESAVFTVGASRVRTLLDEGFRGAERLSDARAATAPIRASTFLVNTALNVAAAGAIVGVMVDVWGMRALFPAIACATLGVLVASEGLPRLLASRQSIRLALLSAPFLIRMERAVRPFLSPFVRLEELFQRRNGEEESSPAEREVRELAELGRREGVVGEEERQLVERVFRMDELAAWDVMIPRVDIFAWSDDLPLDEIVPQLHDVPYSRVPVYGESIDDITGILYVREAYEAYVGGRRDLRLTDLSREPFFIPGSLPLPRLLTDFQVRRIHMGIVADEFGGTDGLVTLEDVIEELVGEIEDETDVSQEHMRRLSRDEIEVDGGVELREVNYAFNVSLPHLEHRSLNGFILEELGHVPDIGRTVELPGLTIEILDATDTQVVKARLRKIHTPAPEEA